MSKKIIFVGSFASVTKSSLRGGMTTACQYILDSSISDKVEWILIDSTPPHNHIRSFWSRLVPAIFRLFKFLSALLIKRPEAVFVFTAHGFGFYEKGLMIILAKLFGKETILAPRSGFILSDIQKSKRFENIAKYILSKSDKILCQGTFWKTFFIEKFKIHPSKLIVINNCIDERKFLQKENYNSNKVSILFLGWVEKNKGIFDLVKAIEILKDQDVIWRIAGEGIALEEIKTQLSVLKLKSKVEFLGWIHGDQKLQTLRDSDILVLPSYREGMPNSVMEAMASKTAVVSTNVGAVPDLITHGVNGFLFEPGDSVELSALIKKLLDKKELRIEFSEKGFNDIEKRFSIKAIIPKFKKLLLE